MLTLTYTLRVIVKAIRRFIWPEIRSHFEIVTTSNHIHFNKASVQGWLCILMLLHLVELLVACAIVKGIKALLSGPEPWFGFFSLAKCADYLVFVLSILVRDVFESGETLFVDRKVTTRNIYFSRLFIKSHWIANLSRIDMEGPDWIRLMAFQIFWDRILFPKSFSPEHAELFLYLYFWVDAFCLHFCPLFFFLHP